MQIIVVSNEILKKDFTAAGIVPGVECIWVDDATQLVHYTQADAYIDLLFDNNAGRIKMLQRLLPKLIIINSVEHTLAATDASFVRINGWPTFLQSPLIECSCTNETIMHKAEALFKAYQKKATWLADMPGFVTPRIISMIINEAYFALQEGVSTKEEIDTAMKLGTNYPYGPFEWSEHIGLQKIAALLQELRNQQPEYMPCELLLKEANGR